VNDATTGDPNGKLLPKWLSYQEPSDAAWELGDHLAPQTGLHKATLDFLDGYFAAREVLGDKEVKLRFSPALSTSTYTEVAKY
jgi:hypothetical protein